MVKIMSIKIQKNIKLSDYCTFKIGGMAEFFVIIKTKEDLIFAINWAKKNQKNIFILGSGSNVLFSDQKFSGLVIKNEIKGMEITSENEQELIIRSASGESWSRLVYFSIEKSLYGMENTFYIPGTVGAAPVQNIGAYGVELKDFFYNLSAINLETGQEEYFNLRDCQFAYRDSIFKQALKGKYFILWVEVKLKRNGELKLDYPDIQKALSEKNLTKPTLKELTEIIREIRDQKLPNPAILPNAGSFFKNPIINSDLFVELKDKYLDLKYFINNDQIKIPAAWLIEKCGFKGRRFSSVGVYDKQALIIVNHGGASQLDILDLSKKIKIEVKNRFKIDLEEEVNIL